MNGFLTGLMMVVVGLLFFLPAYLPYRRSGRPFIGTGTGAYGGVLGAAFTVFGVVTVVVSLVVVALG